MQALGYFDASLPFPTAYQRNHLFERHSVLMRPWTDCVVKPELIYSARPNWSSPMVESISLWMRRQS